MLEGFVRSAVARVTAAFLLTLLVLTACKGRSNTAPANVGGGYTLEVSGGTLNDGSGTKGLVVLATLRDGSGNGPGASENWTLTVEGPGISSSNPLVLVYDDGSPSSYMAWWWNGFDPQGGAYTARATNGTVNLVFAFTINAQQSLVQPNIQVTNTTVSWQDVSGAASYYYRVADGWGYVAQSGYVESGAAPAFELSAGLPDGSYQIEVYAQSTNRVALMNAVAAAPQIASQENLSVTKTTIVRGGAGSGYTLNVRGGALYMGSDQSGASRYGLAIWSSILTDLASPTPPAGAWTLSVAGPGLAAPLTFTYPGNHSHYIYWDFGVAPAQGTYTLTASAPGTTALSQSFTIPLVTAQLPVADGISVAQTQSGAEVSWTAVTGAASYYVNLWTDINGVYTEVAGGWVNTASAVMPKGTLTAGAVYDVYITACQLDMTTTSAVPVPAVGTQVNMSDNTFTPVAFTAQ